MNNIQTIECILTDLKTLNQQTVELIVKYNNAKTQKLATTDLPSQALISSDKYERIKGFILWDLNNPIIKNKNIEAVIISKEYSQKRLIEIYEILNELETWAKELGYEKTVLETVKRQTEAVALYNKSGYKVIPNYGQYIGVDNSICFEKILD